MIFFRYETARMADIDDTSNLTQAQSTLYAKLLRKTNKTLQTIMERLALPARLRRATKAEMAMAIVKESASASTNPNWSRILWLISTPDRDSFVDIAKRPRPMAGEMNATEEGRLGPILAPPDAQPMRAECEEKYREMVVSHERPASDEKPHPVDLIDLNDPRPTADLIDPSADPIIAKGTAATALPFAAIAPIQDHEDVPDASPAKLETEQSSDEKIRPEVEKLLWMFDAVIARTMTLSYISGYQERAYPDPTKAWQYADAQYLVNQLGEGVTINFIYHVRKWCHEGTICDAVGSVFSGIFAKRRENAFFVAKRSLIKKMTKEIEYQRSDGLPASLLRALRLWRVIYNFSAN